MCSTSLCDSIYVQYVHDISECEFVWLTEKAWDLESSVSPRDVGFWCFPNQRSGTSSDEDVMSSSGFFFLTRTAAPRLTTLLLFSLCRCLCFRLSLYLSLYNICLAAHFVLFRSLSLSLAFPLVTLSEGRRLLFFLWMGCVVYSLTELFLSALMMNTYSVTTNFLLYHGADSPLNGKGCTSLSLWGCECVLFFCGRACVRVYACGPECWGVSVGFFSERTDKNILFPKGR